MCITWYCVWFLIKHTLCQSFWTFYDIEKGVVKYLQTCRIYSGCHQPTVYSNGWRLAGWYHNTQVLKLFFIFVISTLITNPSLFSASTKAPTRRSRMGLMQKLHRVNDTGKFPIWLFFVAKLKFRPPKRVRYFYLHNSFN